MDTFVKLVEALAWPVSVLAISLIFRTELRMLLVRINKFKYKEFHAEFEKKLGEAEKEAELIPHPDPEVSAEKNIKKYDAAERLVRIAEVSPRASITEAWIELEAVLSQVVDTNSLDPRKKVRDTLNRMPHARMIQELVKENYIPEGLVPIYKDLRDLRNNVAHNPELIVEFPQAERYIHLSMHFSEKLQVFNKNG